MLPERARRRALTLLLILACSTGLLPPAGAEEISIRFLSPPANRPISGETRIALEAGAPPGSRILKIDLYIDEQLVATLEKLPFEITWNAGEEFQPHSFRAVAQDDAGRSATATLRTPVLRIGQHEAVNLVNLYVAVIDAKGMPVTDLGRGDFTVLEDGTPQEITHFTAARQPLSVALLLDGSNSMGTGERLEIAKRAAIEFIKKMDPKDRLLVMSFSDTVEEMQSLTADRKRLEVAIRSIVARGGTALYDAVSSGASKLKDFEGRKAMVLLSDGRDQALSENSPGSLHLFEEAVESVSRAEVAVYAIGLGARLDEELDLTQRRTLQQVLETFSQKTGGRFYNPVRASQLSGVYDQISEDLSRQYSLAYSPRNTARDGGWRVLAVGVNRPGAKTLTRSGYFAPPR